jgi:Fe-S cluster biosynthesis and repair protein YggX
MGQRIVAEICKECWGLWLKQQTMLINHYGLNVMDPQARAFLTRNLDAFLFKSGRQEDVDTTKQGTINW